MINKVILLGNVGKAPELYEFENGKLADVVMQYVAVDMQLYCEGKKKDKRIRKRRNKTLQLQHYC